MRKMSQTTINGKGTGWIPDYPSIRDYTLGDKEVKPLFSEVGVDTTQSTAKSKKRSLPTKADEIRPYCSHIEDQETLGSCTAQAGVGMIEYFERKAFGKHIDASSLFLYKVTRNLLRLRGDTGAYLRSTMGALRLFGVPPEEYWKYDISKFDREPPAFCYAFASNYQAINYVRLDTPNIAKETLLYTIKDNLSKGIPAMFGFTVHESIEQASNANSSTKGNIPFPCSTERVLGGHAVMAVGYDDNLKIENKGCSEETIGAILIRNSWGTSWGDHGYGYLPYEYVLRDLAVDWWTIIKADWVDTGHFG
ncbi:Peptidase C1A papain [Candidatus Nitrosocosmicus franklandus]|uniref:Peptidase C1A papain n=2 Tax=Candidatus Nitrosocosmicus franklandianus TaxID=1798806 RepID=A0A484IA61_9ARCH|nr:Peptidase C1A papain [Candidatus Nitrosocosmicus franklandus]